MALSAAGHNSPGLFWVALIGAVLAGPKKFAPARGTEAYADAMFDQSWPINGVVAVAERPAFRWPTWAAGCDLLHRLA